MVDIHIIHHTDKMAAAVTAHQIQGRQIYFYIKELLHQIPVFIYKHADAFKLQICDLFDHMIFSAICIKTSGAIQPNSG